MSLHLLIHTGRNQTSRDSHEHSATPGFGAEVIGRLEEACIEIEKLGREVDLRVKNKISFILNEFKIL